VNNELGGKRRLVQLDSGFIEAEGIDMNGDDILSGWGRMIIDVSTAVRVATYIAIRGCSDDVVDGLGCLLDCQVLEAQEILDRNSADLRWSEPAMSQRKWLYLEMKALYECKDRLSDPFDWVESIFCDFGYPDSIAGVVRWMPLQVGQQPGKEAMMERWAEFLEREHEALLKQRDA